MVNLAQLRHRDAVLRQQRRDVGTRRGSTIEGRVAEKGDWPPAILLNARTRPSAELGIEYERLAAGSKNGYLAHVLFRLTIRRKVRSSRLEFGKQNDQDEHVAILDHADIALR